LDRDFQCYAAHDQAPSRSQLKQVAAKYGCKLPDDFVAHSTGPLGGIYIEVNEEVWPRAKEFDIAPFWSFLYGLHVFGLSRDIQDWMNIDLAAAEFRQQTDHSLVPCLRVMGDADMYLFNAHGRIVRWSHETDELEPFAGGFFELFEQEVRELRQRKDRKVAGGAQSPNPSLQRTPPG